VDAAESKQATYTPPIAQQASIPVSIAPIQVLETAAWVSEPIDVPARASSSESKSPRVSHQKSRNGEDLCGDTEPDWGLLDEEDVSDGERSCCEDHCSRDSRKIARPTKIIRDGKEVRPLYPHLNFEADDGLFLQLLGNWLGSQQTDLHDGFLGEEPLGLCGSDRQGGARGSKSQLIGLCFDGGGGPSRLVFEHIRIEAHGSVHNVDRKRVHVQSVYDMHRLLWPFSLNSVISTCTEYRQPLMLSHIWENSPYCHSFSILDVAQADLCICIERVSDGIEVMFGQGADVRTYATLFRASGSLRPISATRPIIEVEPWRLSTEESAGTARIDDLCDWLFSTASSYRSARQNLSSSGSQQFSEALRKFLIEAGAARREGTQLREL